jgi:hypothetical protein
MRVFSEAEFEEITGGRHSQYKYSQFLTAISKFPAFCGEKGLVGHAADLTEDQVCMKELATLFAHILHETNDMSIVREAECDNGTPQWFCDYYNWDAKYLRTNADAKYFGRGALMMRTNKVYGQFSEAMFRDATVLLDEPDFVSSSSLLAFTSAIWLYMTP